MNIYIYIYVQLKTQVNIGSSPTIVPLLIFMKTSYLLYDVIFYTLTENVIHNFEELEMKKIWHFKFIFSYILFHKSEVSLFLFSMEKC